MAEQPKDSIGVVIVDDHRMFAEGLGRLLAEEQGIELLGVADTAAHGIELAARVKPRVMLIDYNLPGQNGILAALAIKRIAPATMIVILTGSGEDRVLLAAIEAGCSGFITKDRAAADVADAVRAAAAGEAVISPLMLARLLPRLNRTHRAIGSDLTERERQILTSLGGGLTNRAIASELHLSVNTIRNYVQSVLTKLDAHSKLQAVSTAVREGIISFPSEK